MPINLSTLLNASASIQLAKAWVNFDGTTATPSTIRSSYNVSSITKNGTGDYTVNFASAMADANYSVTITASSEGNGFFVGGSVNSLSTDTTAPSTSAVRIFTSLSGNNARISSVYTNVQIFGN
jgi:hypothetical protein